MEELRDYPPELCHRCLRAIPLEETCYNIGTSAIRFTESGAIQTVGAIGDLLVCRECARITFTHTLEEPFTELLRAFDERLRPDSDMQPIEHEMLAADVATDDIAALQEAFREALTTYPENPREQSDASVDSAKS